MKLINNTPAHIGQKVEVLNNSGGHKAGAKTIITKVTGIHFNHSGHEINLNKWLHIVECGKWLQNLTSLKCTKPE